tara:strand:- start:1581 stop:1847 length:267 start_codon:yes stop_codon:yes gene_type:complete
MKHLKKEIKLTDHFVERYFQRVLGMSIPSLQSKNKNKYFNKIFNDLNQKISDRDKKNLLFLKNVKNAKVPFNNNLLVMKNGTMITVLN